MANNLDYGRVGVIMGGVSNERDISLKSGNAVLGVLLKMGFQAVAIDLDSSDKKRVRDLLLASKINLAFVALHGFFGEDGQIQSILDELKIPYTGSSAEASRLAMNKICSHRIFKSNGLNVPRYQVVRSLAELKKIDFGFPLVIKPVGSGSSIGLSIIDERKRMKGAFDLAKSSSGKVIIEEFVAGREFTVGILNEKPLPVVEIIPKKKFFDFQAKYKKGLTDYVVPAKLDPKPTRKAQDIGLKAHRLLGCSGFSRVDMILREDDFFVLEVNSIPGMTETSLLPKAAKCIGIGFDELCGKIISLTLKEERIAHAGKEK